MPPENLPSQPDQVPIKKELEPNISLAVKIFAEVSSKYPASGVGQATAIAKYCKEHQLNPIVLKDALVQSKEAIRIIVNAAEHAHEARGKKINFVTPTKAKSIISNDFSKADALTSVSAANLDEILSKYAYYARGEGEGPGPRGEYGYLNFVKDLTQIDLFYV
jgi:hypothetical protein